ncbi:MAG: hypothetical protein ACOYKM_04525 [Caulobacterales bacterium]|jgi:hypothetical protein
MTEGEVVEQMIEFTNILLVGTGVFFTILSVYVASLHYVLHNERLITRLMAFFFLSVSLMMLGVVLLGAQGQHAGLVARLFELEAAGQLSAAGSAGLLNATSGFEYAPGGMITIDEAVVYLIWLCGAFTYAGLYYLTFHYVWRDPE